MRIAITHPTTWPEVRRGTERFVNELADWLGRRGHEVTVLSSHSGPGERTDHGPYATELVRRLLPISPTAHAIALYPFILPCLVRLLRDRYDVVHCCSFADALAASLARSRNGTPYVFYVNGVPPTAPRYRLRPTLRLYHRAIRDADEVVVISRYAAESMGAERRGVMIAPPVDTRQFRPDPQARAPQPTILCTAALDDPRKGAQLLVRAFDRLKTRRPDAALVLAGPGAAPVREALLAALPVRWHGDVEFRDAGQLHELPDLYRRAWVTVLPSLREPFGMVVLESLASGTPVVGARSGALPEILTDTAIGMLFEPGTDLDQPTNVDGLVQALDQGLTLAARSETSERCRRAAEPFSWERLGPEFERLYERLVGAPRDGLEHRQAS